jgi:hypothetical protein
MKTIIIIGVLLCFTVFAHAQNTPVVDARQQAQKTRIRQGASSGEVTRTETKKLRAEQRHIKRTERRAKADGRSHTARTSEN